MANTRKLTKAGMTVERQAGERSKGKPTSKFGAKVEKKADKIMGNPAKLLGGKVSKKASAIHKGIEKQYTKDTKKK